MADETVHGWRYYGQRRPAFAAEPGPGQESVWDYPRPPRIETDAREVIVHVANVVVAQTRRACRVLETASPPTFYLPKEDVAAEYLLPARGSSSCEWKGTARYWSISAPSGLIGNAGWSYDDPNPAFEAIRGWIAFYPARLECRVDGIRVMPQPGGFYGGWVTPDVIGPFKGDPGSAGW